MHNRKNNKTKEDRNIRFRDHESAFQPVSLPVKAAAYAVPLCVLPSALWRIYAVFFKGFPPGCEKLTTVWESFYIAALSAVTFGAALLTIGLVRPWGEVVPGWIPILGGREIPVRAVVVSAGAGAALIFGVYAYALLNPIFHFREITVVPGCPPPTEEPGAWLAIASYAPLLAWGPLLVVVTVAYYHRRRIRAVGTHLMSRKIQRRKMKKFLNKTAAKFRIKI